MTARDPADRKFFEQNIGDTEPVAGPGLDEATQEAINQTRAELGLSPLGDDEPTLEEEFGAPAFNWQETVVERIEDDISDVAKKFDMDLDYLSGWFNGKKLNLINWLETTAIETSGFGETIDPNTPEGMFRLVDKARTWMGMFFPAFRDAVVSPPTGGRPRGGSGRRRPSAAEIRAQFDMDELTNAINQMSRALLVEEADDARSIASSFVNAIVRSPDQELDFETFVRNKLLAKPRAKAIYKNKPEGLSEEQFLQPYVQAAMQRIGPGFGTQLADIATGGARLGASPQAFQARLNRTRQVQTSTPFLRRLGERVGQVRQVLR